MDFRKEIEAELRKCLQEVSGKEGEETFHPLKIMNLYHLGFCDAEGNLSLESKGKYLRPQLCMAICAGMGGNPQVALPAAAGIELIHRTSLIFDDIQDGGTERNGQPSVKSQWGVNQAINAGLALSSYARLVTHRLQLPLETVLYINTTLESAVISLCEGQYRDILYEDNPADVSLEGYLDMINGKTAKLFGCACLIGAVCAGVPEGLGRLEAEAFGINMGMAFQIQDDYLGIWADSEITGKTSNDLDEGKCSLPVVLAYQQNPTVTSQSLKNRGNKDTFIEWMEKQGVRDDCRKWVEMYRRKAIDHLDHIGLLTEEDRMIRQAMSWLDRT